MESPRASNASPTNEVRRIDSHNILHAEKGTPAPTVTPNCNPDSELQRPVPVAHRSRENVPTSGPPSLGSHGFKRLSNHDKLGSIFSNIPATGPGPGNIGIIEHGEVTKSKSKPRRRLSIFEDALQDQLTRVMVHCPIDRPRKFIPDGQLKRLVNPESIERELLRHERTLKRRWKNAVSSHETLEFGLLAKKICGETTRTAATISPDNNTHAHAAENSRPREYRKIFTILILLDRPHRISSFIQEDICDDDLPLLRISKECSKLATSKFPQVPLTCIKHWKESTMERFEEKQWTVLAPSFKRKMGERDIHRSLHEGGILPFTSWKKIGPPSGFSQLYHAEVHPDHHSFHDSKVSNRVYAVKELLGNVPQHFKHEIAILNSLSCDHHTHPHLITLLATYESRGRFYLIFPCAEADLLGYWGRIKPSPPNNSDMAQWVAKQCCGLAEGLSKIHRWETLSGTRLLHPDSEPPWKFNSPVVQSSKRDSAVPAPRQLYGRHGDIKPQNILWFDDGGYGTLKITDFGIAHFSSKDSVDAKSRRWVANSPQYRAPETDFPDLQLSPSWDIWTLGSVYLEFITWYFGGWKAVDQFAKDRLAKDPYYDDLIHTITFFTTYTDEESGERRAKVKEPVVNKIRNLSERPNVRPFFLDFLAMIEKDMLVVETNLKEGEVGRKTAHTISTKLSDMVQKCKKFKQQGYI